MSPEGIALWTETSSDPELIAGVRAGDPAAFGVLYERHVDAARKVAHQYTNSHSDVDDVVSESFSRVLRALQRGDGPDLAFRAYLFTIVRRTGMDIISKGIRTKPRDDMSPYESAMGYEAPSDEPAMAGFEHSMVSEAFTSLPERWQAVLWYTEVEKKSPKDIAPLLGLSANGVAALAYRAREALRQAYLQQHLATSEEVSCMEANSQLGAYVRGGLAKREHAKIDTHVRECARCTALVVELQDVNRGMRAIIAPLVLGSLGLGALEGGLPIGGAFGPNAAAGGAGGAGGAGAAGAGGTGAAGASGASAGIIGTFGAAGALGTLAHFAVPATAVVGAAALVLGGITLFANDPVGDEADAGRTVERFGDVTQGYGKNPGLGVGDGPQAAAGDSSVSGADPAGQLDDSSDNFAGATGTGRGATGGLSNEDVWAASDRAAADAAAQQRGDSAAPGNTGTGDSSVSGRPSDGGAGSSGSTAGGGSTGNTGAGSGSGSNGSSAGGSDTGTGSGDAGGTGGAGAGSGAGDPTTPGGSTDSGGTTDLTDPTDPSGPGDPDGPTDPNEPSEPDPDSTVDPTEPTSPPAGSLRIGRSSLQFLEISRDNPAVDMSVSNAATVGIGDVTATITLPEGLTFAMPGATGGTQASGAVALERYVAATTDATFLVGDWECGLSADSAVLTCELVELGAGADTSLDLGISIEADELASDAATVFDVSAGDLSDTYSLPTGLRETDDDLEDGFEDQGGLGVSQFGAPVLGCDLSSTRCQSVMGTSANPAGVLNVSGTNNNDHTMVELRDEDDQRNGGTTTVTLPEGATVTHASLEWSANRSTPTESWRTPDVWSGDLTAASLRTPDGEFQSVAGVDLEIFTQDKREYYLARADVTDLVKAAGEGEYSLKDIATSATRFDNDRTYYGGFTLTVVYEDPAVPAETSVKLLEGPHWVSTSAPATRAFDTEANATVTLSWTAFETDLANSGDYAAVDGTKVRPQRGTTLGSATNAGDSWANGSIFANTLGTDAKGFAPVAVGAGRHQITVATSGDNFFVGTFAVTISHD